jgi:hypothetical protein
MKTSKNKQPPPNLNKKHHQENKHGRRRISGIEDKVEYLLHSERNVKKKKYRQS